MSDENSVQNSTPTKNSNAIQLPYPAVQSSGQLPGSLPETSPLLSTPPNIDSTAQSPSSPAESAVVPDPTAPQIDGGVNVLPYPVNDATTVSYSVAQDGTNGETNANLQSSGSVMLYQTGGINDQTVTLSGPPPTSSQPGVAQAGPPQNEMPPPFAPQYTNYGTAPPGSNTGYMGKTGEPGFSMPAPPPSYDESTYNMMTTAPPQQYMVRAVADYPMQMNCPNCHRNIVSNIEYVNGGLVYLMSFIMIVIGLWIFCCCLIPFFMDSLKDVSHRCPHCHTFLGRYNKM